MQEQFLTEEAIIQQKDSTYLLLVEYWQGSDRNCCSDKWEVRSTITIIKQCVENKRARHQNTLKTEARTKK